MFYKIIKDFFLKKIVNKRLLNYSLQSSEEKIKTIGVVVDEKYFLEKERLIAEIEKNGFEKETITVLVFKDKVRSKEMIKEPFYSYKDISISGKVSKQEVIDFIDTPFDLLISYYDEARPSLLMISKKSNAKFKVGFTAIDKRINHFMIAEQLENYNGFVSELFKYLKILNKI